MMTRSTNDVLDLTNLKARFTRHEARYIIIERNSSITNYNYSFLLIIVVFIQLKTTQIVGIYL